MRQVFGSSNPEIYPLPAKERSAEESYFRRYAKDAFNWTVDAVNVVGPWFMVAITVGTMGLFAYVGVKAHENDKAKRAMHLQRLDNVAFLRGLASSERHEQARLEKRLLSLSDKDGDGVIGFSEQLDAWQRMGYEFSGHRMESKIRFPEPSVGQLEQGIRSYELEQSQRSGMCDWLGNF